MNDIRAGMRSLSLPRTGITHAAWVGMAAAYSLARLVELALARPDGTPDTEGYLETVGAAPMNMLTGTRPFTTPLLWTLVGGSPDAIEFFQVLLASASWACLAVFVSRAVQTRWLKYCAFAGVAAIGLGWDVSHWNNYLLGESFAFSLFALVVACWLWLLEEWRSSRVAVLVLVTFLWANVRDSNAYALLMLAAVIVAFSLVRRKPGRYALLTIAFVCIVLTAMVSSMIGNRWVFVYLNVIGQRILPDAEKTAYFAGAGMPVTPALMRMSGKFAPDENAAFYRDPSLESFRQWTITKGRQTYVSYVASHPLQALAEPFADARYVLAFSPSAQGPVLLILLAAPCVFLFAVLRRPRGQPLFHRAWLVPAVLLLLVYPHAAVIWHGDVMSVDRHFILPSIQLQLGLCLVLLFSIDSLVTSSVREPLLSMDAPGLGGGEIR